MFLALITKIVALRKESVDRNVSGDLGGTVTRLSLSARRAWIEIELLEMMICGYSSLSARRAWIEIAVIQPGYMKAMVALRKESVDRNWNYDHLEVFSFGRSPQGERG